ncbi:MAG: M18 family aminopeptidase, partial [Clostridia bacterium]|nr:M18 family aminopeptidase [Clostridia bacterium]
MKMTKELLKWIDQSPTAFHAVQNSVELLQQNGFEELFEGNRWNIQAGKGYYVTRNQSSLIAFRVPVASPRGFMITASHTDSPMFKLKPEVLSPSPCGLLRLNTELYGGAILPSWLDRPLSLAGRVIIGHDGVFEARLVNFDRDMLIIPNVAIHQNRKINSGFEYNLAVYMLPLFSDDPKASLKALVAKELAVDADDIMGMDLYV